jgi:hypothetical protein
MERYAMSDDHNAADKAHAEEMMEHQREQAIERAIYAVKMAIQPLTEDNRKRVLDAALGELDSKLSVRQGSA